MGILLHGSNEYAFEDRLLAHLKMAIAQKLRKQESFFLSWAKRAEDGGGRVSIWLSPGTDIAFHFHGSKPPELNVVWVKALAATSHTHRGLVVISEEEAAKFAQKNPDIL
ncbi:DUF7882 family protein [Leucobacter sp. USHLN153]|uniref:DUF7882 family protein n=1 Tax=Leucobacter sp. USHLN153 TaxID=3081268 RepID=UPI0030159105